MSPRSQRLDRLHWAELDKGFAPQFDRKAPMFAVAVAGAMKAVESAVTGLGVVANPPEAGVAATG
jgi:hypothetical protein